MSILEGGFKFSFAKEEFYHGKVVGIPMISFCDIPITLSGEHKGKYGEYAIGISKNSSTFKELPLFPVTYIVNDEMEKLAFKLHNEYLDNKSFLSQSNKELSESGAKPITIEFKGKKFTGFGMSLNAKGKLVLKAFFDNLSLNKNANSLLGSMKLYKSEREGAEQINYDECEWRLVYPEYSDITDDIKCQWIWDHYDEWRANRKDKFLTNAATLQPSVEDITYLIVPKTSDIFPLIKRLSKASHIFGDELTEENRSLLFSKVISFEQIEKDF
jgi:hypothetical protein